MINTFIENFHWIRPYWLLLLALLPFIWLARFNSAASSAWGRVVDSNLLAALQLSNNLITRNVFLKPLLSIAVVTFAVSLAGPAWEKQEQPVFRADAARVFVLDLSLSMNATDISPSRITKAKHKLLDMLRASNEGQVGLITYAATPFVVSPLTDDAQTIISMVPALDTSIVPFQGSRTDLALKKAVDLLAQAQSKRGDIILIGDDANDDAIKFVPQLSSQHYRLHVLAIGSDAGAPVPLPEGGFLKDETGAIVMPKLNQTALRELASAGNGFYRTMTLDDHDIKPILSAFDSDQIKQTNGNSDNTASTERWRDQGFWLVIPIVLMTMFLFRKGVLGVAIVALLTFHSKPSSAFEWVDLWTNKNQQAYDLFQKGELDKAAATFEDEQWKGTAYYKSGDFENASKHFNADSDPESKYNAATALAKTGRLEDALNQFKQILKDHPEHEDAKTNHDLIEKFLSQQQNKQSNQSQKGDSKENNQKGDKDSPSPSDANKNEQAGAGNQQQNQNKPMQGKDEKKSENDASSAGDKSDKKPPEKSDKAHAEAQQNPDQNAKDKKDAGAQMTQNSPQTEQAQALQQWLRRVPDDPSGLLREKYRRQAMRQAPSDNGGKAW